MNVNKLEGFLKTNIKAQEDLHRTLKLLQRVKEEVSFCHSVENKLRLQLTKAQDRNIALQREIIAFKSATDKMCNQQKVLKSQENEIAALEKVVAELKLTVELKVKAVTNEAQLTEQVAGLKKKLSENDAQSQLARIEQQLALKDKERENKQLEEKLENTTRNLEKTQLDFDMMKNELDRIHLNYSKQIMNYEATIRRYEKERQEILGDNMAEQQIFQVNTPRADELWDKKVNITWADAARKATNEVAINSMKNKTPDEAPKKGRSTFHPRTKLGLAVKPMVAAQTAPPLDVVHVRTHMPNQPKRKKLYSSNSNHFLDIE